MKLLPKRMIVACAVAALTAIAALTHGQGSRTLQKNPNLTCKTTKIAAVHNKPSKDQDVQMPQHKIVESNDARRLVKYW